MTAGRAKNAPNRPVGFGPPVMLQDGSTWKTAGLRSGLGCIGPSRPPTTCGRTSQRHHSMAGYCAAAPAIMGGAAAASAVQSRILRIGQQQARLKRLEESPGTACWGFGGGQAQKPRGCSAADLQSNAARALLSVDRSARCVDVHARWHRPTPPSTYPLPSWELSAHACSMGAHRPALHSCSGLDAPGTPLACLSTSRPTSAALRQRWRLLSAARGLSAEQSSMQ